jgi:hypothetical protein
VLGALFVLVLGACHASTQASTAQTPPPQQPGYYPQPYYPPGPNYQAPPPGYPQQQAPSAPQQAVPAQRPLLAPLVGAPAMQQELRNVLTELINALPADRQALVRGIPLVFDPTVEVNAYAGCDKSGAPFLAATAGIFDAVDAIAQTKATDELFGTRTYDAYTNAVIPDMTRSDKARAALPAGIIPTNLGPDPRRWSRAHEMFDEILAFTFGHELAHHYMGHTGCAHGQPANADLSAIGRDLSSVFPVFNQFQEGQADTEGCYNALDAGRARRPQYEWSERGGLNLLDYFSRLENAALGGGGAGLGGLLTQVVRTAAAAAVQTHPFAALRVGGVNMAASYWRSRHPG